MLSSVWSWLVLHWRDLLDALIAIDVALIPIFPNAGVLGKIKSWLSAAKSA